MFVGTDAIGLLEWDWVALSGDGNFAQIQTVARPFAKG